MEELFEDLKANESIGTGDIYEQIDVHSSQITVEESLFFSAWLCLSPEIDSKTKAQSVNEVLETTELNSIMDSLVGIPGVSGLST
uniref:Uncharacterized protein n=1 Tax=Cucumis sativus TaxID=3659 RepID=A0A0A0LCW7_CUCSA